LTNFFYWLWLLLLISEANNDPLQVVDYIVVHELVHLIEKNHSKEFWNKVKFLMPDYGKYKNWLKEKGYLLTL